MATSGMRGLSTFIADIRNCQNKEAEKARVEKEMANIRSKIKGAVRTLCHSPPYGQQLWIACRKTRSEFSCDLVFP
jgi:SepF-like predicted cell division protein (DUF552 family)